MNTTRNETRTNVCSKGGGLGGQGKKCTSCIYDVILLFTKSIQGGRGCLKIPNLSIHTL